MNRVTVVHTFGRHAGNVQTVHGDRVRFGRAPDNDVVFDADFDRDASAHHAELRCRDGAWVLFDLQSRNGTFIAGDRVVERPIRSGEEVTFGSKGPRVRLDLTAEVAAPPAPRPVEVVAPPAPRPPREIVASPAPRPPLEAVAPAPPPPPVPAGAQKTRGMDPPAAPPAPPAGARVGQRTIAMMISSAVAAATGRSKPRKTQEIQALIQHQVDVATAGQRRSMILLGGLLLVAFAGLGALILHGRRSGDEIAELRSELAQLSPEDPRRKQIEGRLGRMHPPAANFGRNLYDRSKKGVFMLASRGQGFCTAFAVRPDRLATNAHCVVTARKRGGSVTAVENEGGGRVSFAVTDMRTHPGYRDTDEKSLTPDVAILTISGRSAVVLELAGAQELATAGAGDDVYLIGFPGRLMDTSNPAATFLSANIGRITTAAGRPGAFAEMWLVQHDAPTTHGTSGSPVFNARGRVIAVNAGGYLEGDDETIAGKKTEVVKASPYKFGMRVDLLDPLLR